MADFDAEVAALTAAAFDHLGSAAQYIAREGEAPVACRVTVHAVDMLVGIAEARLVAMDATIEVAVAALPAAPVKGALFVQSGQAWRIVDRPRRREDDLQVWTCDVARANV